MAMCESGRKCANIKAACAEWRTKALDVERHPVVERALVELVRERAMRKSTGCECLLARKASFADVCGVLSDDATVRAEAAARCENPHAANCLAMEGSRLRSERNHWRDRAHAMLAAAREFATASEDATPDGFEPGTVAVRDQALHLAALLRAHIERAYAEPKHEEKPTDGR